VADEVRRQMDESDHRNDAALEDELDEAQANIKRYSRQNDTARLQAEYEHAEQALAQIRKEMPNMAEYKALMMGPAERLLNPNGSVNERNVPPYPARVYDADPSLLKSYGAPASDEFDMQTRDVQSRFDDPYASLGKLKQAQRASFNADNAVNPQVKSYYGSPVHNVPEAGRSFSRPQEGDTSEPDSEGEAQQADDDAVPPPNAVSRARTLEAKMRPSPAANHPVPQTMPSNPSPPASALLKGAPPPPPPPPPPDWVPGRQGNGAPPPPPPPPPPNWNASSRRPDAAAPQAAEGPAAAPKVAASQGLRMDELRARVQRPRELPKFDLSFNDFLARYKLNGALVRGKDNPYQALWKQYQKDGDIPPEQLAKAKAAMGDDGRGPPPAGARGALMAELLGRGRLRAQAPKIDISFPDFLNQFELNYDKLPGPNHPYPRLWRQYLREGVLSPEQVQAAVNAAAEADKPRPLEGMQGELEAQLARMRPQLRQGSSRAGSDDSQQWAED
jgi:hypothetical protein